MVIEVIFVEGENCGRATAAHRAGGSRRPTSQALRPKHRLHIRSSTASTRRTHAGSAIR